MLKIFLNRNVPKIALVLLCITFALIHTSYAAVRTSRRQPRTQDRSTTDMRSEQLQNQQEKLSQAAEDTAKQIDSNLVNILELVNKNQKPDQKKIDSGLQSVQSSTKFLSAFSKDVQCQHFMLKAWANYFNEDPTIANQAASRAYRTDPENNDAHITQAAIAILTDNKPITIKTKSRSTAATPADTSSRQRQRAPRRRQTRQTSTPTIKATGHATTGQILQLDVDAINADLLGEKIQPLKLNCINATSLICDPAQTNLCVMLWQLPESSEDPNDPSQKSKLTKSTRTTSPRPAAPDTREQMRNRRSRPDMMRRPSDRTSRRPDMRSDTMPERPDMNERRSDMRADIMMRMPDMYMMRPEMMPTPYGLQPMSERLSAEETLESQMNAFGKLFDSEFDNPEIKFFAVNINQPNVRKKVVETLLQNPWPWAQVMANDPTGGAEQFKDFDAETPTLAITDKNATIKYAGPAEGFLAPMVLEKTAGITLKAKDVEVVDSNSLPEMTIDISEALKAITSNPELMAQITSEDGMLAPEQFQAEKLQSFAEGLFAPAAKKGAITYKQTVELCRQIMKDYPDTPQAEQARQLLRQIPEAERKRYKVTNEELGL